MCIICECLAKVKKSRDDSDSIPDSRKKSAHGSTVSREGELCMHAREEMIQ